MDKVMDIAQDNKSRTIFCHFSFRRPKGTVYGLFSVAFYKDFEGKKCITHVTRKYDLWEDHQFITAIQSYSHALQTIYEFQGLMKDANIRQIMLVTDNSTLAGWILNPKKNKNYASYMNRAVEPYRFGSYKEIVLGVGICEPRRAEKSYKYCKEEFVSNEYKTESNVIDGDKSNKNVEHRINLNGLEYQSIDDIINSDKAIPIISGIVEVD